MRWRLGLWSKQGIFFVFCASCGSAQAPGDGRSGAGGMPAGGTSAVGGTSVVMAGAAGGSGLSGAGAAGTGTSAGAGGSGVGGGGGGGGAPAAGEAGAGGDVTIPPEPDLERLGETQLTSAGLSVVSYGGYLNGESFQQEGVITHQNYQYAAFWNTARHVVLARRALPSGPWQSFELSDYTNSANDAHNTISLGIAAGDGTLHVAFDHHDSPLHYRKSVAGLASTPETATWAAASFSAVTNSLVSGAAVDQLTYPRFVSRPGGNLLLSARLGASGSGDEYLWEYSATTHQWVSLGRYVDGTTDNVNAYLHGLSYGRGSERLHASWCWRDTSNASTNHDLLYLYSDDHGRTWRNSAGTQVGTSGTQAVRMGTAGIKAWEIAQNRGLINQEHMTVDAQGRVHVLLSHLPDAQPNDSNFDSARGKSAYFHYLRDASGKWSRQALDLPTVAAFRGKLALSRSGNLYAVLPDLRIAAASATSSFATFSLLYDGEPGRFFSDPLIDATRLLHDDTLSVVYAQKASPNIYVVDFRLE